MYESKRMQLSLFALWMDWKTYPVSHLVTSGIFSSPAMSPKKIRG